VIVKTSWSLALQDSTNSNYSVKRERLYKKRCMDSFDSQAGPCPALQGGESHNPGVVCQKEKKNNEEEIWQDMALSLYPSSRFRETLFKKVGK
jgi:hypothetical protein